MYFSQQTCCVKLLRVTVLITVHGQVHKATRVHTYANPQTADWDLASCKAIMELTDSHTKCEIANPHIPGFLFYTISLMRLQAWRVSLDRQFLNVLYMYNDVRRLDKLVIMLSRYFSLFFFNCLLSRSGRLLNSDDIQSRRHLSD